MHQPVWGGWGGEERDPTKDPHVQSFGEAGFTVEAGEGSLTLRPVAGGRSQEGPASSFLVTGSPRQEAMRGILNISWGGTNSSTCRWTRVVSGVVEECPLPTDYSGECCTTPQHHTPSGSRVSHCEPAQSSQSPHDQHTHFTDKKIEA